MKKKHAAQAARDHKKAQYADQTVSTGTGGEVHQTSGGDRPVLTTQQGIPVADNQNSLKIGSRGPTALEDFHLREKLFHFDHERIPERVVHARGFGAHGYFENYEPLTEITKADLFQRAREKTPLFVRFSTVVRGGSGWLDSLGHSLSGAWRVADYAAVSRVVRLSEYTWSGVWPSSA